MKVYYACKFKSCADEVIVSRPSIARRISSFYTEWFPQKTKRIDRHKNSSYGERVFFSGRCLPFESHLSPKIQQTGIKIQD